jgi:hypothetical protein
MQEKLGKARAIMYTLAIATLVVMALVRIIPHHH